MAIGAGRLFPAKVSFKAADFGNTRGGILAAITESWKEEKVDQYADTVVNRWGAGMSKVAVDLTMAEMTEARMEQATSETAVTNVIKVKATSHIGSNMLALAGVLQTFPIIDGIASALAQVTMPLAFPMFDLAFAWGENPQGMKLTFGGFPDETDGDTVAELREV